MGFINILRWKWMVQVTFGGHVNVQNNVFWPEGITKYCYSDSISQWRWLTLAIDAWTWKLSLLPVYGSRDLKITYSDTEKDMFTKEKETKNLEDTYQGHTMK
jgi:hypothetical protein